MSAEPVVGDVEFIVASDGDVKVVESLRLFDADDYHHDRDEFVLAEMIRPAWLRSVGVA